MPTSMPPLKLEDVSRQRTSRGCTFVTVQRPGPRVALHALSNLDTCSTGMPTQQQHLRGPR